MMSAIHESASEAKMIVQDAFDRFQEVVTSEDMTIFYNTSLQNVITSARNLENNLATRQAIPNTGRLNHLFMALERYVEAADEIRCDRNLTALLWAPVKLTLEMTAQHGLILKQLITAYKSIAKAVPNFGNFSVGFRSSAEFQQIMAVFYSEILEFHGRVYGQLRKPGWNTFFESFWDKYKPRFELMLQSLSKYSQIMRQAPTLHVIGEVRMTHESKIKDIVANEEERSITELANVHSWLDASNLDQDDKLDDLHSRCHKGSCDWIFENAKIKSWIRSGADHSVLWLKGKPGSGKSVLCGKLVEHLSGSANKVVVSYFCNEALPGTKLCHFLLRSFIRQLLHKQPYLCSFVQKGYINNGTKPSIKQLREITRRLLIAFTSVRVIADGIDECNEKEQRSMLNELLALTGSDTSKRMCKVLISSQDTVSISRRLQQRSTIDLSNEHAAIQTAISAFVRSKIDQSPLFSCTGSVDEDTLKKAEHTLVDKADGMFLWVQLVIAMLEKAYSPQEMQQALEDLPNGLEKLYQKIFARIEEQSEISNRDKASRIFQWLACSHRQLRKYELQDAVTLHQDNTIINEQTKAHEQVFELCKPLVESSTGGVVRFVHVTVKDFLLKQSSDIILFELSTAQFNATFSCLAYLDHGFTLIDDQYDDESRLVEIGKGFHGLCQYACRYWIEHLLAYLQLTENANHNSKKVILKRANSLAQTLSAGAGQEGQINDPQRLEKQARLDKRSSLLKAHEPLYSFVLSYLEAQLAEKILPKHDGKSKDRGVGHPIQMIRRKYESLVAQVLRAESIPGLNAKTLAAFKKNYSVCVLVCRFANCPRELHGFASADERDQHENTHKQVYKCPHPTCSMHRIGLPSNRKLQQHLLQFHPERMEAQEVPSIKPFGEYRMATDATLVNTPPPHGEGVYQSLEKGSDNEEEDAEDEDEEGDEYSFRYGKLDRFAATDSFALGSTQWIP